MSRTLINYEVPFYSNTADGTHCWQAALRMILKFFEPTKEYSWQQLETVTNKQPGLWTWIPATLLWMKTQGYKVVDIETFDYQAWAVPNVAAKNVVGFKI